MRIHGAQKTALLLAVFAKRNGTSRLRISEKTVETVAGRKKLNAQFVVKVMQWIQEYGWTMVELSTGGYGLIRTDSLCGAKAVPLSTGLVQPGECENPDVAMLERELGVPDATGEDK